MYGSRVEEICDAGRTSFFGGRWTQPCEVRAHHSIGSPGAAPIELCDVHCQEVAEADLVVDQNITEETYQRRENLRKSAPGRTFLRYMMDRKAKRK
jgi:hypothetical protein